MMNPERKINHKSSRFCRPLATFTRLDWAMRLGEIHGLIYEKWVNGERKFTINRRHGIIGLEILLAGMWLALGNLNSVAQEGCVDNPTTSLWCGGGATIIDTVTISPYAGTNAPYGSIVCVGATVTLSLAQSTLPSTNCTQTCHNCPSNYCDPIVTNNGASPYDITNEYFYETPDNTNGYVEGFGSSASITITDTNGFGGWGYIWLDSAEMTTNAPGCWYGSEDNTTEDTSYAFVAATGIWCDGEYITSIDGSVAYLAAYCPGKYVTVTASPNPGMADQFLPSGWTMTGGIPATNADGSLSRTTRLVSRGSVGLVNVKVTSGSTSQSVNVIIYQAVVTLYADQGGRGQNDDVGHAWWQLSSQPSAINQFLLGIDPDSGDIISLSSPAPAGPQDVGGYYDHGDPTGPGQVIYGQQPDFQTGGYHVASGSFWACTSFNQYIATLQYVFNLAETPGTYVVTGNNCTTQAEEVAIVAGWQGGVAVFSLGILVIILTTFRNTNG
jgi:hypothetical protein